MSVKDRILIINPGSTSTKVAVFKGEVLIKGKNLSHSADELKKYEDICDQFQFRMNAVLDWLRDEAVEENSLCAVVGRGGLLRPMPGGTYKVTDRMIEDLKVGIQGKHASNLGGIIAKVIGDKLCIPSFIVDPVAVDEFHDIARVSGLPELPRRSLVHALNVKAVSRRLSKMMGRELEELNLIVAHLGGGITIAAIKEGKIIDANVATDGGPFSPERCGGVPVGSLIELAFSGKYNKRELHKMTSGSGGLMAYLGTNDGREVEKRINSGDKKAKFIFEAMAYQISKEIAAMSVVLFGKVDSIILTGGLSNNERLIDLISRRVKFIAPMEVIPGEDEMLALAEGACRVLTGQEKVKVYEEEVFKR